MGRKLMVSEPLSRSWSRRRMAPTGRVPKGLPKHEEEKDCGYMLINGLQLLYHYRRMILPS